MDGNTVKRFCLSLPLLVCMVLTGCATTSNGNAIATAPADPLENIHTLVRQIHLDHGNHNITTRWNEMVDTQLGVTSSESIRVGLPVKSGVQLDAVAGAISRDRDRTRFSNKSSAPRIEALNAEANAAKGALNQSSLVALDNATTELENVEWVIGNFCRDQEQGKLHRFLLNGVSASDPLLSKPLTVSSVARKSQVRLACISGSSKPYQSPFLVDLYYDSKPNRRLKVHLTATVLTPKTQRAMLEELEEAGALP